ncbi:hypothetical protein KW785_00370 [Candidatus Parcubacteria bacterium]|nr:hypothetical protein [Candidatus Parcubacteria bacterium]
MKKVSIFGSFLVAIVLVGALYVLRSAPASRPNTASVNQSYSGFAGPAELPRAYVDTTMPTQSGQTINVTSGGNLQAALDTAQPGDTIVLQAGATYTGNFVLRNKSNPNNQWIVIKSNGALPPEGRRVKPTDASQLAKIQTGQNYSWTLDTEAGANYYRLIGLEVTVAPTLTDVNQILSFGTAEGTIQNTLASVPHHLILDRSYVHGLDTLQNRKCIGLHSAWSAVVESYISKCENDGFDVQAITMGNGPGPYKINNNYLEASAENIAIGGFTPHITGLIPSDVEIRGNHIFKPLSWRASDPSYDGIHRSIKNLVEFKSGVRVLIEGNVLENSWQQDQAGWGFALWSANSGCSWCTTSDITIRNNMLKNVNSLYSLSARYDTSTIPMKNLYIANNLDVGQRADNPPWRYLTVNGFANLTFIHNTGFSTDTWSIIDPSAPNLVIQDNVGGDALYTIFGSGANGTATLNAASPSWLFDHNTIVCDPNKYCAAWTLPPNNMYPENKAAIGFVSSTDFHLSSNSPYKGKASDGSDPGADIDAVLYATRGAVSGDWSGSISLPPPPPPTSGDTTAPSVPQNLQGTASDTTHVNLSWSASTDNVAVTGYKIFKNGALLNTVTNTSYTDGTVVAGTSYSYSVSAMDAAGNSSAQSSPVSVLTPVDPSTPPPTILGIGSFVTTTSKVNVRSTATTKGKPLGQQKAGSTGVIVAGPQTGSGYTWWQVDFSSGVDGWVAGDWLR